MTTTQDSILKKPTIGWALASLASSVAVFIAATFLTSFVTVLIGFTSTVFCAYVLYWSQIHPRIYLWKQITLLALVMSGAFTFVLFGKVTNAYVVRKTFQLTGPLVTYTDPVEKWSVSYPKPWNHEEKRVSGIVNHSFRPSRITPAMYFSITSRANVGTSDLAMVTENFIANLPQGQNTPILENELVSLGSGLTGRRMVYSDTTRRIPLKNEVLIVLDGPHLYFLNVGAAPRWFDRHRSTLEQLLYSLKPSR